MTSVNKAIISLGATGALIAGAMLFGGGTQADLTAVQLTKVHIIGTQYLDIFDDGTEVQSTAAAYHALALPHPVNPKKAGANWVVSVERPLYDTPSGNLDDNEYAVDRWGQAIVKMGGDQVILLDSTSSISGDKLTPAAQTTIVSKGKLPTARGI